MVIGGFECNRTEFYSITLSLPHNRLDSLLPLNLIQFCGTAAFSIKHKIPQLEITKMKLFNSFSANMKWVFSGVEIEVFCKTATETVFSTSNVTNNQVLLMLKMTKKTTGSVRRMMFYLCCFQTL